MNDDDKGLCGLESCQREVVLAALFTTTAVTIRLNVYCCNVVQQLNYIPSTPTNRFDHLRSS